jgi:hypothetical protein
MCPGDPDREPAMLYSGAYDGLGQTGGQGGAHLLKHRRTVKRTVF